jgi:hypothetical protein
MKSRKLRRGVYVAALLGLGAAITTHLARPDSLQAQSAHRSPPATARRPAAVTDLASTINQTAAVVEGSVADIQYDYTEEDGPWTTVMLSNVRAHLGESAPFVEIRQFGGPLPNGKTLVAAELPVFERGKRYVVFLRNTAWNVSPVVGDLSFRVDVAGGAEVLLNSDGLPVTAIGAEGIGLGASIADGPQQASTRARSLGLAIGRTQERRLDRRALVQSLRASMAEHGLSVGGPFYDRPAGEFKWRALPTARVGRGRAAGSFIPPASRAPERDASDAERQ